MAGLAFVTGASSGIGQALARRYLDAGYSLALVTRRTAELRHWACQAAWDASRYRIYAADVTNIDSIVAAGRDCMAAQGLPDVVIACAGISIGVDTREREDLEVMARVYATNNIGLAATFHPFLRGMQERGSGTLVGIASVNGVRGFPGHGATCASKAAVISYCESLRAEMRQAGVRVVTLSPGYVDTPLTRDNPYAMPFLISADRFAQRAFPVIQAGKPYCVIPWQMGLVAQGLRLLPRGLFDRMFGARPRKRRINGS